MAKSIVRYTYGDRVAHWILAVTFVLLVLTGLGLFERNLAFLFGVFGGGENALLLHKYAGVLFFLAGMKFFLSHWKETSTFDDDDKAWLRVMGGYLNKNAVVPPMGKYNTGQKIFGMTALFGALAAMFTGVVLWNAAVLSPELVRISALAHALCFVILATFFIAHLYLGAIGVAGSLGAMTSGSVSESWAKRHAPKWLAELKKAGKT